MRRYEVVFVLAPTVTEEDGKQLIAAYSSAAEELGAKVLEVDEWGKRRLAFPVKKFTDGIYVVFTLEEEAAAAVTELERRFKVTDSVIRFLTVRIDQDLKRAEKLKTRRESKRARLKKKIAPPKKPSKKTSPKPEEAAKEDAVEKGEKE
jgi:small subunit ribosomal protein S6